MLGWLFSVLTPPPLFAVMPVGAGVATEGCWVHPANIAAAAAITARQDNTASDLDGFMTNNFLIMPAQKRGTLA